MFLLALAARVALGATPARAAPPAPLPVVNPAVEALRRQRRLALVERGSGWVLAGASFATIACGVVLVSTSYSPMLRFDEGAANRSNGLITLGVGVAALAPALVLAVLGQRRITDLDWRLKELSVAPLVGPAPGGVLVGARLRF